MTDLISLLPHSKKDAKLDTKNDRGVINEVADMKVRQQWGVVQATCVQWMHEQDRLSFNSLFGLACTWDNACMQA